MKEKKTETQLNWTILALPSKKTGTKKLGRSNIKKQLKNDLQGFYM